jgi:peptide/nickel transport system substrate-binding protein
MMSAALALSACGGPAQPENQGTSSGASASESASTGTESGVTENDGWDVKETPYDQVKDGGEFIGVVGSIMTNFNIDTASSNDAEWRLAVSPMRGPWYFTDGSGNLTINPDYLESAEADVSGEQMVVTLKQNPKAVWGDGTAITVEDWKATWDAMNGLDENLQPEGEDAQYSPASSDGWNQIVSVEQGETAQDIIMTFKAHYPDWLGIISGGPLPAKDASTPEAFNTWATPEAGMFSGPFTVDSWDPVTGTLVEKPNPNWWGQAPKLEKITWRQVGADQMGTAFANGETDMVDISSDVSKYELAKGTPGAAVRVSSGPNFRHFTINSKAGALTSLNIRKAVLMGLDRTAIAQSDLAGLPIEYKPLSNNIFVSNQSLYQDLGAATGLDYNPDEAKKLIEGEGYTMNDSTGYYEKDGQPLTISFTVLTGVVTSEKEGLLFQNQMKEMGINVPLTNIDSNKDWPGVLDAHDFEVIAFSWIGTPFPLMNINQIYGCNSDSNYAQLCSDEIEELEKKISTEMDVDARNKMGQEVAKLIWEEVHTIPLWQRPSLMGVPDNLANFGSWGMATQPYDWTTVGYTS